MYYIIQFALAFFATMGFALIYDINSKHIVAASIVGGIGWSINKFFLNMGANPLIPGFVAAFVIGSLSELASKNSHAPAITYFIPAIIPIVPGGGMYYTMYYLILQDYQMFIQKGIETFIVALAIAMGIFLSTSIINSVKDIKHDMK